MPIGRGLEKELQWPDDECQPEGLPGGIEGPMYPKTLLYLLQVCDKCACATQGNACWYCGEPLVGWQQPDGMTAYGEALMALDYAQHLDEYAY